MTENNNIENLFKDALSNYEAPVDASLWQGIEHVVGQPPVAAPVAANTVVKSFSAFKLFIAATTVSVVGVTSYFVFDKDEVKPSSKIETNTTLYNNAGSVSETKTQPTPEKIVVNEAKTVSVTKKQSSPEIFPVVTDKSIGNVDEKSSNTTTEDQTSPKPSENNSAPGLTNSQKEITHEQPEGKIDESNPQRPAAAAPPSRENVKLKEDVLTFPGIDKQVFTPNSDGKNDVFEVDDSQMQSINIKIISTSGKSVYLRDKIGGSWDGTLLNGDEAPEGLYIVFINATGLDGKKYSRVTRLLLERN